MTSNPEKLCSDCGTIMRYEKVEQEFNKEGIRVVVSGIPAWKCPNCGVITYKPEIADHVVRSANELIEMAKVDHPSLVVARTVAD